MSYLRNFLIIFSLFFFSINCRAGTQIHYSATGKASWYGNKFHGKKTASCAIFNKNLYSAAHRSLPLFSVVRITSIKNNKSIVAIINDRGPKRKKILIDLSEKSAIDLGFKNQGIVHVKIQLLPDQSRKLLNLANTKNPQKICHYFHKHRAMFN